MFRLFMLSKYCAILFSNLINSQTSLQNKPVNVAFGKVVRHCSGTTSDLTDGLTDLITIECDRDMFVEIELDDLYYIQYIIVYCARDSGESFDHFEVTLQSGSEVKQCGIFHTRISYVEEKGYRVNCKKLNTKFNVVYIFLNMIQEIVALWSEVEVYTFGQIGFPDEKFLYFGCYIDANNLMKFTLEDIKDCAQKCFDNNLNFMAIREVTKDCICGSALGNSKASSGCDVPCTNSRFLCGGRETYSVYMLDVKLPNVELCSGDNELITNFGSELSINSSDIPSCILHCENYLYAFMARGRCACTNRSISHITGNKCGFACPSNPNSACTETDYVFFSTCRMPNMSYMGCNILFQCKSRMDMYGECEDGCLRSDLSPPQCIGELMNTLPEVVTTTDLIITAPTFTGTPTTLPTSYTDVPTTDISASTIAIPTATAPITFVLTTPPTTTTTTTIIVRRSTTATLRRESVICNLLLVLSLFLIF